ncbi:MAG TPA: cytochrome c3 family protein [Candidatus Acidoferrales bacterium]|nr:cytochrome c3 family protein [Candidatus Acidoferrales bacterium]
MASQEEGRFRGWGGRIALILLLAVILPAFTALGLRHRLFARAGIEQPIFFSHKLHAGEKQIPCQYCHAYARRSTVAGVPSVQTCMGCHSLVGVRKPEVRKLAAYWQERQPIPWVRIHSVPDFVYFPHKRHVRAGVRCQECHGPVETMDEVYQFASLQMGWCLNCHNQRGASVDCATCHK